jgi:pilus assembly protein FimV
MKRMGLARGLLTLLLLPGISQALGLGDVHLNSPLNAPLDAEIELVNTTPEDLATLEAKLASKETFERYGLEWPPFMSGVTVTRDRAANGTHILRIKSSETVTEPFLTLLIEATWARGRLVREYTVLLDPPVFAPNSVRAAPVATPSTSPSQTTGQISRPAPQQAAPSADTPAASAGGGDSYEVQRGDSLSAIARRLSSSTGARPDQLMVSIYRGNPGAFEGDMNRLRAGSVLRIPSGDEVAAVSPSEASGEVRRLAGAWAGSSGSSSGRLRLVPPSESGASAGTSAADAAEMNNLRARVSDLEGQLNESKRMLELRNTELANLQQKLAESQQGARTPAQQTPPPPVETPPEAVAQTPTPTPEPAEPEATPPETAVAPPEATPPEQTAATPTDTPTQTTASPETESEDGGILGTLLDYWYVLAGLIVVGLLLVVAKTRGKKKSAEFEDNLGRLAEQGEDRLSQPLDALSDTGRMRAPQDAGVPDDILVEESGTHRALQETQDIPLSAANVRTDETISSETAVNLDQGDPLAEADFHMAYGLYDQAADLVRIAIQREPDRRDLKLKLLEVFFVWGNKEQFLTLAHELNGSRSQAPAGEWDKIVIMGKQIAPEDPLFAESGAGGSVGVDLDLDAGGSGRVDFDPFDVSSRMDVTGGGTPDPIDLDLGNALRDADSTGESVALPGAASGQTTREMTVKMTPAGSEAPTVEQPALRPLDEPTIREKVEGAMRRKLSSDQTAELALDDLGLELGSLEQTDSQIGLKPVGGMPRGNDSNAPTMVAGLDENSQRLLAAAAARSGAGGSSSANGEDNLTEHGASGTWFLTERELGGDVDLTKGRSIDPSTTASMAKFEMPDEGFDVSSTSRLATLDKANLDFPVEPTQQQPAMGRKVDLDLGAASGNYELPGSATEELAVPDLEPVTLSEVGTKLDLARAYVDMGDPDGARNILNEVLSEGSASQKQEAQRLLESLPG